MSLSINMKLTSMFICFVLSKQWLNVIMLLIGVSFFLPDHSGGQQEQGMKNLRCVIIALSWEKAFIYYVVAIMRRYMVRKRKERERETKRGNTERHRECVY